MKLRIISPEKERIKIREKIPKKDKIGFKNILKILFVASALSILPGNYVKKLPKDMVKIKMVAEYYSSTFPIYSMRFSKTLKDSINYKDPFKSAITNYKKVGNFILDAENTFISLEKSGTVDFMLIEMDIEGKEKIVDTYIKVAKY